VVCFGFGREAFRAESKNLRQLKCSRGELPLVRWSQP